ncbi:hypothetical protein ADL12_13115 [Streptomyces regalis]|uniref:Uncharacterized protein n=1 Tax=Streptomyces regalis TaxID=68262 RepID=A0A0X3V6R1_9ACTN|nr:hypothetical protein ADL12_13115 [Streptomyces regalis]
MDPEALPLGQALGGVRLDAPYGVEDGALVEPRPEHDGRSAGLADPHDHPPAGLHAKSSGDMPGRLPHVVRVVVAPAHRAALAGEPEDLVAPRLIHSHTASGTGSRTCAHRPLLSDIAEAGLGTRKGRVAPRSGVSLSM